MLSKDRIRSKDVVYPSTIGMKEMNIASYCTLRNDIYVYDFDKLDIEHRGILLHEHDNAKIFPLHRHDFYEVYFVKSGTCNMAFQDYEFEMNEHSLLIMNPNISHKTLMSDGNVKAYCLSFNFHIAQRCIMLLRESHFIRNFLINGMQEREVHDGYIYFEIQDTLLLRDFYNFIEFQQASEYHCEIAFAYLYLILSKLDVQKKLHMHNNKVKNKIEQELSHYLDSNLKHASLADFQKIMNYSYERLSKLIREETGFTFSELLCRKRIDKVSDLLEHTDIKISLVLEITGVKNRSYFEKKFIRQKACTMKEYRIQKRIG